MPHLTDRFLTFVTAIGLIAASLGGFAAYVTRPLLDYAARSEQAISLSVEEQISRAGKADDEIPDRQDTIIDAPIASVTSPAAAALLASIPLPPRRPNHLRAVSRRLLNDAQITGIKNRLGLSTAQAEHWPAVESALRDVARRHLQGSGNQNGAAPRIEVSSPEVQRLIGASVPLIKQLREDQKREVRELIRMIGLGTVASHI